MKNATTNTTNKLKEAANLTPELVSGSGFGSGSELQFIVVQHPALAPLLKKLVQFKYTTLV